MDIEDDWIARLVLRHFDTHELCATVRLIEFHSWRLFLVFRYKFPEFGQLSGG